MDPVSKEEQRRSSTLGALPSSLGSADRESLKILEHAEEEGYRRGRGRGDGPAAGRVLLVGASAVGKTTLLRSMIHSFDGERVRRPIPFFIPEDAWMHTCIIMRDLHTSKHMRPNRCPRVRLSQHAQTADATALGAHLFFLLRELLRAMRHTGVEFVDASLEQRARDMTRLQMLDTHMELVRFEAELSAVLDDPAVTELLSRGQTGTPVLPEHTVWFFSQHARILSDSYTPLLQDLLRMRVRTTGVGRYQLRKLGRPFEVLDVGGMRAERRKWSPVMHSVDCAVFVAALSEWDCGLAEDDGGNRMAESLQLYKTTHAELTESCACPPPPDDVCPQVPSVSPPAKRPLTPSFFLPLFSQRRAHLPLLHEGR